MYSTVENCYPLREARNKYSFEESLIKTDESRFNNDSCDSPHDPPGARSFLTRAQTNGVRKFYRWKSSSNLRDSAVPKNGVLYPSKLIDKEATSDNSIQVYKSTKHNMHLEKILIYTKP